MQKVFYVKDYCTQGASDNQAIQACMAEANRFLGQKTVVFDGKDYEIDEAILLSSNTHVIIDGVSIRQKDNVFDNVFRGENMQIDPENPFGFALGASVLENVKIEGKNGAKLIGPNVPRKGFHPKLNEEQNMTGDFWGWRTLMIFFCRCKGCEISGLSLSQTTCWALNFEWCSNVYVHDIEVRSNVKNGDGVDFRSGCHHCRVENLSGFTSDDSVACTALYESNPQGVMPSESKAVYPMRGLKVAPEGENGDIHDIEIKNITTGGKCHGCICYAGKGNKIYNVLIDGFEEAATGARASVVKLYTRGENNGFSYGDISDITLKNIRAKTAKAAVEISVALKNVRLENIATENPDGQILFEQYNRGNCLKNAVIAFQEEN